MLGVLGLGLTAFVGVLDCFFASSRFSIFDFRQARAHSMNCSIVLSNSCRSVERLMIKYLTKLDDGMQPLSSSPIFAISLLFIDAVHSPLFCPSFRRVCPSTMSSSSPTSPPPSRSNSWYTFRSAASLLAVSSSLFFVCSLFDSPGVRARDCDDALLSRTGDSDAAEAPTREPDPPAANAFCKSHTHTKLS